MGCPAPHHPQTHAIFLCLGLYWLSLKSLKYLNYSAPLIVNFSCSALVVNQPNFQDDHLKRYS